MTTDKDRSGQSRAEALRQKRQQSSQVHVNNVHQQVNHPSAQARAATTVRRTSPYAVPAASTSRTASARKLHYARGANGVEVRMPAMPSLHFSWRSASLLLAASLLAIVLLLTNLDTFQVSSVQLTGNKRITASQVSKIVAASKSSIFTLDSQKIIATVQSSFPEFSEIHLGLRFPNTVVLAVKERKPILAWVANGKTQWIAADGVVMSVRGDGGKLLAIRRLPQQTKPPQPPKRRRPLQSNRSSTSIRRF
jgi:alpha-L-arabinofuranosidase